MPYHLKDHLYLAQFQDEVILLDTSQNKYTICSKHISVLLIDLLEKERDEVGNKLLYSSTTQFSKEDIKTIQNLIDDNIIEWKDTTYPFYIDRKLNSSGVLSAD